MRISSISSGTTCNKSSNFRANLWVSKCVKEVIKPNEKNFVKAAEMCDSWLKKDMGHILKTMTIRQNTALNPNVAFERTVYKTSYAYPFEELGYPVIQRVKEYEDLEFEINNRKCGFWFNKDSSAEKLFNDFKNMFYYLNG